MKLYNPDPNEGGVPTGDEASGGAGDVFGSGNEDNEAPAGGAPITPAPAAGGSAPPSLSADDIAAAMKKAGLGAQSTPPTPEKQYTQDDFNKAFNVWQPSKDLITAIRTGDENAAMQALVEIRDGLNKQSVTMASYIAQQVEERIRAELSPVQSHFREQQTARVYKEFFDEHKDLQPYEAVAKAVVTQMKAEGASFDDQKTAFKALSDRVRSVIKSLPGAQPPEGGNGSPSPTRMPTLSRGGQGGTGGKSGAAGAPKITPGHSIFNS